MTSWPAANGMRCVKPSMAMVSPSWTSAAIASRRVVISAMDSGEPDPCVAGCQSDTSYKQVDELPKLVTLGCICGRWVADADVGLQMTGANYFLLTVKVAGGSNWHCCQKAASDNFPSRQRV